MRRLIVGLLAAFAAIVLGVPSASATTWTVTNGGDVEGVAGATTLVIHDPGGSATFECISSSLGLNLPNGTSNGLPIGTVNNIGIGGPCSLDGVISVTVSASGFPWNFNALSISDNIVTGSVTGGIGLDISSSVGCGFSVTGTSMPYTYDTSSFELNFNGGGDLTTSGVNVAGCQNLIHDGDSVGFFATYALNPPPEIVIG